MFKILYLIIIITFICYMSWLLMHIFLFDQFIIPTESMIPTLLPGDRIIVDKSTIGARIYSDFNFDKNGVDLKSWRIRGSRSVKPNDIVVFNFPYHEGKINFVINNVYAKRCIGIPGDSVSIINGHFLNNNYKDLIGIKSNQDAFSKMPDHLFPPEVFDTYPHDENLPWTIKNFGPLYLPRRGDFIFLTAKEGCLYKMILEWETGKSISFDWKLNKTCADGNQMSYHVFKHSYYFMCGDNVANSRDSRYWGLVPEEYIVGVVSRVSYSIDKHTGKYRPERFLKKPEL